MDKLLRFRKHPVGEVYLSMSRICNVRKEFGEVWVLTSVFGEEWKIKEPEEEQLKRIENE